MTAPADLAAAIARLKSDPVRWARQTCTIRDKHKQLRKFDANGVQRNLLQRERAQRARQGNVRQYILKARQAGISTWEQILNLHTVWATTNVDALTIADKQDRTEAIFEITTRVIRYFPPALLPHMSTKRAKEINFPNLDAKFRTDTAGAADPARGLTLGRFHGSEFAHWAKPRETLASATPSMIPDSAIVLETTANMYEDEAHDFWRETEEGGNSYEACFYPWWDCDPLNYRRPLIEPDELLPYTEEEQLLMANAKSAIDPTQRGLDPEQIKFRRMMMKDMGVALFMREYAEDPETCWMAAGDMFYEADLLKWLLYAAPEPIRVEDGVEYFRDMAPPGTTRFIVGSDTAEGGAKDRFTYEVQAFPSGALMERYESSRCTPEDFADRLNTVGRKYRLALLVIEKNFHGITVHRRLRSPACNYPIQRIYHRQSYAQNTAKPTREMGWLTNADTKALLLDHGRQSFLAARDAGKSQIPKGVIKDAFAIRRDEEGKIKINGRDNFVAHTLARAGRDYPYLPLGSPAPPTVIVSPLH